MMSATPFAMKPAMPSVFSPAPKGREGSDILFSKLRLIPITMKAMPPIPIPIPMSPRT